MDNLWIPNIPCGHLVIRAGVVFIAVLLLLRLSGKRQVGQMGIAQFVAILLISNAVQNAMNGGDNSLAGGLILAVVLILLSYTIEVLSYRSKRLENLVQGRPTLLIHQGKVLYKNLRHELVPPRELRSVLRRHGIHDVAEVDEAILESDGFISIVKKSEAAEHSGLNASKTP